MLPPQGRCLSLEEASLGEGRLTGERTEQETQRVRRLFSNHHGVIYFIKSFLWRSFSHLHKPPPQLFIWLSEELYTSLSWSIFHSSHFSLFSGKPSRDSTRFFGSVSLLQSLFFTNLFHFYPSFILVTVNLIPGGVFTFFQPRIALPDFL